MQSETWDAAEAVIEVLNKPRQMHCPSLTSSALLISYLRPRHSQCYSA